MSIVKEVKKIIVEDKNEFLKDSNIQKLQAYYEEMRRLGIAKKQEYTLPQLDTTGVTCLHREAE